MTEVTSTNSPIAMRTLPVRMTDELRARLEIIAQLKGHSLSKELVVALEHWVEDSKTDPEVLRKADTVRADIERDAKVRSDAINAIFSAPIEKTSAKTAKGLAEASS